MCVIRTRSAGAGPFLIIGIRGRCLFSGDYGVSGPGAWPGSHLGLDAPFLTLSALGGGDSLPTVMHRLPPARGHRERLRPGVLWGDRGGPPRGVPAPAFLLSPRRVCTRHQRPPVPWAALPPASMVGSGDLPRLTQHLDWPLLPDRRVQAHMGLTPASTGPVFTLRSGRVCAPPRQARGSGDSLSLRPVRTREARCRVTCHPHPVRQRGSCFLIPNLDSSLWGPLPHYWGPPHRFSLPVALLSAVGWVQHCALSSSSQKVPSPRQGRHVGAAGGQGAHHPWLQSILAGGCCGRGGARFHDARGNPTQTLCRPLASPPYCGVFPSRARGCRESWPRASLIDSQAHGTLSWTLVLLPRSSASPCGPARPTLMWGP